MVLIIVERVEQYGDLIEARIPCVTLEGRCLYGRWIRVKSATREIQILVVVGDSEFGVLGEFSPIEWSVLDKGQG